MASIVLLLSELLRPDENLDTLMSTSFDDHSTATAPLFSAATKSSAAVGSLPQSCKKNALLDNPFQEDLPRVSIEYLVWP
ncbi:hypothetical protein F511_03031 [Dorcoceras hygrometricum]|nr:hypothetical protein F511_03031 [Dorcoceras hygrometricum]